MVERYFNPDQQEQLDRMRADLCGHSEHQAERDWAELIEVVTQLTDAVRAEQAAGTGMTDPRMIELSRQWRTLIDQFTGGGEIRHPLAGAPRGQRDAA